MAKNNSELSIAWRMLHSSRPLILVRSLVAHHGVTLAQVAGAAIDLGLAKFTMRALVRALQDGEEVIAIRDYNLAALEKKLITAAIAHSGSLEDAAGELGVRVAVLQARMRRHGVKVRYQWS